VALACSSIEAMVDCVESLFSIAVNAFVSVVFSIQANGEAFQIGPGRFEVAIITEVINARAQVVSPAGSEIHHHLISRQVA
jgi:hypothetical protein